MCYWAAFWCFRLHWVCLLKVGFGIGVVGWRWARKGCERRCNGLNGALQVNA